MKTFEEKMEAAKKAKYYKFEYSYIRYNPQIGDYESKSSVIAKTEKEAIRLATKKCNRASYGYNTFGGIISKSDVLVLDKDYSLEKKSRTDKYGYSTGVYDIVAEEIYHYGK